MAHFAKLNSENIVEEVIAVSNFSIDDLPFPDSEQKGIDYLNSIFNTYEDLIWKQTSYNSNFRKNYAGIGYYYDEVLDGFIPPKVFDSWTLDEETCLWTAPIPYPGNENEQYYWDEEKLNWIKWDNSN